MTRLPPAFEELADLAWALVNGGLDAQSGSRLRQLLDSGAANRWAYIRLTSQFAALEWQAGEGARQTGGGPLTSAASAAQGRSPPTMQMIVSSAAGVSSSPVISGRLFIPSRFEFFGGVSLAYVAVLLIWGFGLVAAWSWQLGGDARTVADVAPIPPSAPA